MEASRPEFVPRAAGPEEPRPAPRQATDWQVLGPKERDPEESGLKEWSAGEPGWTAQVGPGERHPDRYAGLQPGLMTTGWMTFGWMTTGWMTFGSDPGLKRSDSQRTQTQFP